MGPIIIFDKSVLQSLNPDEAMWLDNFFISNITPLFFIETLADLEKKVRLGRTPEQVVGNLAYKTPDMSSKPNAHHSTLLEGELFGFTTLDMKNGRIHASGGKTVKLGGKTGVIFQPSAEEEALARWQNNEFMDLERLRAKAWRQELSNINLEESYKDFQKFYLMGKPKTFSDVKKFVDFHIDGPDQENVLVFGLILLGISQPDQIEIKKRWKSLGKPSIRKFAPYFTHIFSVDLFFYLAIAADLIGRSRPSNKIDLAYLYYLPFCMVFTSNDKLHADITPFFLRDNQSFVPGTNLKADLAKLDKYYDSFPEDTKKRGVINFASDPPKDDSFLVARLWDKHFSPKWRELGEKPKPDKDSPTSKRIIEEINQIIEKGTPVTDGSQVSGDSVDQMVIVRKVLLKKGKWTRLPPEVLKHQKSKIENN